MADVRSILDANYLHRDPALAETAISKLERGTGFDAGADRLPVSDVSARPQCRIDATREWRRIGRGPVADDLPCVREVSA